MIDRYWREPQRIVERLNVCGTLELMSPAHPGADPADGHVLRDAVDGGACVPATSLAGALSRYLRQQDPALAAELFGTRGEASPLIIADAVGEPVALERRGGLRLDAADKQLYELELIPAGARFELAFELLIDETKPADMTWEAYERLPVEQRNSALAARRERLCRGLAALLQGLERGEIRLGARQRRGLGRCCAHDWRVWSYDLTSPDGLLDWLSGDWPERHERSGSTLAEKLGVIATGIDRGRRLEVTAEFSFSGSLLIRAGPAADDQGIYLRPLHRPGPGEPAQEPVVPGSTLAGVLRRRALRIATTLADDRAAACRFVEDLFGGPPEKPRAGRLSVEEAAIDRAHVQPLVKARRRADRLTGGSPPGAVWHEAPLFADGAARLRLTLTIDEPADADIGLILLLLKDLWTGDLPLGSESGIGRGRLQGRWARLRRVEASAPAEWRLRPAGRGLAVEADGVSADLQRFVGAFNAALMGGAS